MKMKINIEKIIKFSKSFFSELLSKNIRRILDKNKCNDSWKNVNMYGKPANELQSKVKIINFFSILNFRKKITAKDKIKKIQFCKIKALDFKLKKL